MNGMWGRRWRGLAGLTGASQNSSDRPRLISEERLNVLPYQIVELTLTDGEPAFGGKLRMDSCYVEALPQQSKYVFAYREYFDLAFTFAHRA
ncbi:hypothetical protein BBF93_19320 [Hyphomonas sp. CACIAM 19H1]|nr:hypothetical protein [Hyphomonas sp. CACIAM 19H1]AXE66148.1 hypothetical protein BBF93_19320 [Hyphomonas sp. CACIAM 19H1]